MINYLKPFLALALILVITTVTFARENRILDSAARSNIGGSFIDLPQGNMHYEITGTDTSKTVLLVCGFSAGYYIYDSTFQYLKNAGFKVIRYNHFGRGYSERVNGNYDKAFYQSEITELLKALNITEQIHVIASSMGGAIATEFAIFNPHKVKSLTLLDPMLTRFKSKAIHKKVLGPFLMSTFYAPLTKHFQMRAFYDKKPFKGWDKQYKIPSKFKGSKNALFQTMRNYLPEDKLHVYEEIQEIGTPVFLIWGKEDSTLKYEYSNNIRQVLDCRFLGVEDAGHIPHFEKSMIVNPEILKFLKGESQL